MEPRIPPQNLEAEQSVLGALMLDKDAIFQIADFLEPDDFYSDKHKQIYHAILDLFLQNDPVDFLSITNRLKNKDLLKKIGGKTYLTELINSTPSSSNVGVYGRIVKEKKILRDLIHAANEITELGYKEEEQTDYILNEAEKKIFSITQKSVKQGFVELKKALKEAFLRIDKLHEQKGAMRGVPTGFKDLDELLSGLQRSDMIVLASRPSQGKTTLALDIARKSALEQNIPIAIFSLEMSNDQLIDRMLSSQSGVNLWKIRTGNLSSKGADSDFDKMRRGLDELSKAPIFIDDSGSVNVTQIRAMCRRLEAERGLGLIVIDYLQLLDSGNSGYNINVVQQVSEISKGLKAMARELNVPVLVLSQLSRAVEHRGQGARPKLSDLRDSGSIEQDSDVVMFIHTEYDSEHKPLPNIKILVQKHRNGPIGEVSLFFNRELVRFESASKENYSNVDFNNDSNIESMDFSSN